MCALRPATIVALYNFVGTVVHLPDRHSPPLAFSAGSAESASLIWRVLSLCSRLANCSRVAHYCPVTISRPVQLYELFAIRRWSLDMPHG
jgi:hypothetical protein